MVYYKKHPQDSDNVAVLQKAVTNHTDPVNGVTYIEILPSDTENIEPGTYYFDYQYVNSDKSIVKTLKMDMIKFSGDITRNI